MSPAVVFDEAVSILRRMIGEPADVRAIQAVGPEFFGPAPFFIGRGPGEIEITFGFLAGIVFEVASVRIGDRFANADQWDDNPWDAISDAEAAVIGDLLGGT